MNAAAQGHGYAAEQANNLYDILPDGCHILLMLVLIVCHFVEPVFCQCLGRVHLPGGIDITTLAVLKCRLHRRSGIVAILGLDVDTSISRI